jgi:hypothetical protein
VNCRDRPFPPDCRIADFLELIEAQATIFHICRSGDHCEVHEQVYICPWMHEPRSRWVSLKVPVRQKPEAKALISRPTLRRSALDDGVVSRRGAARRSGLRVRLFLWMATKRPDEGSEWFDRALALPGGDDAHRGRASFDAGYLAFWKGDDERSSSLQNRALHLGRQTNDPTITALALVGLARIALRTSVEEARRLCREAIAVTESTADRVGRSSAMHVLGVAAQMAGD